MPINRSIEIMSKLAPQLPGIFAYIAGLSILLALPACQTIGTATQDAPAVSVEDRTGAIEWLENLIEGKSPADAIQTLEKNASEQSDRNRAFQLLSRATELAIDIETPDQVDDRLTRLENDYPDSSFHVRLGILKTKIMLTRNQGSQALGILKSLSVNATSIESLDILDLKAYALEQAGLPIDSIRTRITLDESLPEQSQKRQDNDNALWLSLKNIKPAEINAQISEIPDIFSGWMELASLSHRYGNQATLLNEEVEKWVLRHPGHPAQRYILDRIKNRNIATSRHPDHIALILPLSGKLSAVGKSIRDGFISADLETRKALGTRIKIDVYDTEGNPELAEHAILQANKSGAKFIVGPLGKAAVQRAVTTMGNTIPLLVLNQVSEDIVSKPSDQMPAAPAPEVKTRVYQFSLEPESEAIQAAERISVDQYMQLLVITPENIWGNRIYEAFANRYKELGGEILSHQKFQKGTADYSDIIQQGFNLNLSTLRHHQLKNSLREDIQFTPRRRGDIDGIFIAATTQEARQLKPQLRFYYAQDIPVYATSHLYSGTAQPAKDKDLEGIRFCDMPWVLDHDSSPGSLKQIIHSAWPNESARYPRFYALGADSFHLIPYLDWLESNNNDWLEGYTGRLSVNPSGKVARQVKWARFMNGVPTLMNGSSLRGEPL